MQGLNAGTRKKSIEVIKYIIFINSIKFEFYFDTHIIM